MVIEELNKKIKNLENEKFEILKTQNIILEEYNSLKESIRFI